MLSQLITAVYQAALPGPEFCTTGLCGVIQPLRRVPPGFFFLALGLIAVGIYGLRRRAR